MDEDRLRYLVSKGKHLTLDGAAEIAKAAPELLKQLEGKYPICEICLEPIKRESELIKGTDGCDFHRRCCN